MEINRDRDAASKSVTDLAVYFLEHKKVDPSIITWQIYH